VLVSARYRIAIQICNQSDQQVSSLIHSIDNLAVTHLGMTHKAITHRLVNLFTLQVDDPLHVPDKWTL
jgi:hypothetical protein